MKLIKKINSRVAIVAIAVLGLCTSTLVTYAEENAKDKKESTEQKCKHDATKSECFICDPKLREKGRLWCKEHERYEDRCWECHPEKRDKKRLYCKEHSLYEDECYLCHPEIKKKKPETKKK